MFVKLEVDTVGNHEQHFYPLLNAAFSATCENVHSMEGTMRQFIQDDKGLVAIAFAPNAAALCEMCLRTHDRLSQIGIVCSIGASCGRGYHCIQGTTERREFAVVGSSVNLAARLMSQAKKHNTNILVMDIVAKKAQSRIQH